MGAIPGVWLPNICCFWVIGGGIVSAHISAIGKKTMESADGMIIGSLFGVFYTIFNEALYFVKATAEYALGIGLPPLYTASSSVLGYLLRELIVLLSNLGLSVFVGAAGGLIYTVLFFNRRRQYKYNKAYPTRHLRNT
jgi:hypothetical protein